jgi:transcriptional regulator GlxA family with amidase domain
MLLMYNVGILLFNEVELLDFAGPYEVFSVTSELNNHNLFKVFTVTQDGNLIKTVNGLKVLPDFSFENHLPIDILIIPGGVGTKTEMNKDRVLDWISKNYENSMITMSVCSGARILGKLGLLDNVESTTHHEVMEHLLQIAPTTIIESNKRFVDNGKIMTSGGISAGIDLSLHIVEGLFGKDIVDKTAIYMEYGEWRTLEEKRM